MSSESNRYVGIDVLKFMFVFFIVAIHTSTVNNTFSYSFVNGICRIAVPFYFVASGFFCLEKSKADSNSLNISAKYIKKILRLYVIWTIIYSPVIISGMIADNPKSHGAIYIFFRWLIIQFSLSGSYAHLWYLNATLLAVILIGLLLRIGLKPKAILIISLFLYVLGLFGDSYHGLIESTVFENIFKAYCKIFSSTRNWLFLGFPFISLGMCLSQKEIISINYKTVLGLILSVVLLVIEVNFTYRHTAPLDYNAYLLLPAISVFLFVISLKIKIKPKCIYQALRDIGALMFFSHMYIRMLVDDLIINKLCASTVPAFSPLFRYFLVCIISFILSFTIYSLSEKFKTLKKLY